MKIAPATIKKVLNMRVGARNALPQKNKRMKRKNMPVIKLIFAVIDLEASLVRSSLPKRLNARTQAL